MLASLASAQPDGGSEWPHYGNDAGGARYSPAAQIDRTNVSQLQIAWTFRTGALGHSAPLDRKAAFEATPILVEGKLFLSTPYNHVIATRGPAPGSGSTTPRSIARTATRR